MSEMERIPEVPSSTRDEALFIPSVTRDESRGAPRNLKADLTSLRKHKRVDQVPIQLERNLKLPSTTPKKNHEILPSTQDEALLHCSVSQEIPRSLLELERELETFNETPEASQDTVPT